MRAVILAGGKGTRLRPYTNFFPKPLMPLDDIPILEVVIRQLAQCGFHRIDIATGHLGELLQSYFQDGSRFGVKLTYWREEVPLGTAGVLGVIPDLSEPFLMMNGDLLTDLNYNTLLDFHAKAKAVATIVTYRRSVQIDFGIIEANSNGGVSGYREKPVLEYLVSAGIFAFDPTVTRHVSPGGSLNVPDLIKKLISSALHVSTFEHSGYWLDIGRPDDYERACEEFQRNRPLFWRGA